MVQDNNASRTMLQNYLGNLFPCKLQEEEHICLFFAKDQVQFNRFYRDFDSVIADIEKYKHTHDVFVCLSTVKGNESRTADKINRRSCIVFDFDFKDYAGNDDINYYIYNKFKKAFPRLYSPYIVKSGNGVHIYCFTEPTTNVKQLAELNKEMAELMGADTKACLTTQVIRVPATFNHKNGEKKRVIEYFNDTWKDSFKRDKLTKLKNMVKQSKPQEQGAEQVSHKVVDLTSYRKLKPCTERMLTSEVVKGQRNFVLGRIVADFKRIGHTKAQVKDIVLTWNKEHCVPAKSDTEVLRDLENYWKADYKLLDCNIADSRKQEVLSNYCNKHECDYLTQTPRQCQSIYKEELLAMNNRWLKSEMLKELDGKHYVLISLLLRDERNGMTIKELEEKVQPLRKKERAVIGRKGLYELIKDLEKKGIVKINKASNPTKSDYVELRDKDNTYGTGYTVYLHTGAMWTVQKLMTPRQLKVYLAISKLAGKGETRTLNRLHEVTGLAERTISTELKALMKLDLLSITIYYDNKGIERRKYNIVA